MFPVSHRIVVPIELVAPIRPPLRVVRGGDAGSLVGPDSFLVYLNRVNGDWQILNGSLAKLQGKMPGAVWQQFAGEYAVWTQFYTASKAPIFPQDTTALDWYADRAKAWDAHFKGYAGAGAGLPGPSATGAQPSPDLLGGTAQSVGDLLKGGAWLLIAGALVWLVVKYAPERKR